MKALFWILAAVAVFYWLGIPDDSAKQQRADSEYCSKKQAGKVPYHTATDAVIVGFMDGFRDGYCK